MRVIFGEVMIETEVSVGLGRADKFGSVLKDVVSWEENWLFLEGAKAVMLVADGLMGITSRSCSRYQTKTISLC